MCFGCSIVWRMFISDDDELNNFEEGIYGEEEDGEDEFVVLVFIFGIFFRLRRFS